MYINIIVVVILFFFVKLYFVLCSYIYILVVLSYIFDIFRSIVKINFIEYYVFLFMSICFFKMKVERGFLKDMYFFCWFGFEELFWCWMCLKVVLEWDCCLRFVKFGFFFVLWWIRLFDDNFIGVFFGGDEVVVRLCFRDLFCFFWEDEVVVIVGCILWEVMVKFVFEVISVLWRGEFFLVGEELVCNFWLRGRLNVECCFIGEGVCKVLLFFILELLEILVLNVFVLLEILVGINGLVLFFFNFWVVVGFLGVRNFFGVGKGMEDFWGEVVGKGLEEGEVDWERVDRWELDCVWIILFFNCDVMDDGRWVEFFNGKFGWILYLCKG